MEKAQNNDVNTIVQLVESVYRGDSSRLGWTTEADLLDGQRVDANMVQEIIADEHSVILLHREGADVCACVHLQKQNEAVHLGMLSVRANLQGRSLGRDIIKYCEAYAKQNWGSQQVLIEVLSERIELMAWYERRGFIKTGVTVPFPQDLRFGIPKKQNLFFYEMSKRI